MMVQDLWTAARSGTVSDVRSALTGVVRGAGSNGVDTRNAFGVNALHLAVWHNHLPIVRALLEAGADPDARDGESGWSSLHRALHFGHLAIAAALVEAGASVLLEDSKKRTPLDLISGDVKQTCAGQTCTEVYAWGSGTNYQLGTRTASIQRVPVRLDHLQGLEISTVSAAKFHSAAVTRDGELLTWGFGRGGRLGHPDFHIHSGQVAVITPRQVITGLGGKQVRAVAAAKHHTVIATEGGEVYTWGSNRDGRLGYTSVDSQPIPRRISSFRLRAVAVAASNKHSAVLTKEGEVFTWGCNGEGQLGYGTSNSAANSVPRCVEAMKGKQLVAVAVAKYHTVVLSADGEVFTWGHKLVMPRRVNVARDTRKGGPAPLKFHRAERLHVVAVAAGGVHSTVISQEGLVFYWESSDVLLRCRQLKALAAHHVVSVSAGKHRTAVVTSLGTVFAWDGARDQKPEPLRIPNLKQTTQIAVGESHSVAVATVWIPPFPIRTAPQQAVPQQERDGEESDEELERAGDVPGGEAAEARGSLKDLCEREIARSIVEAKNVLQMTELADALEAEELKAFCQAMVLRNLDYVLMVTPPGVLAQIRPSVLAELEGLMGCHVAQGGWVPRPLPCATASGNEPILEEEERGGEKARESRNGSGEKEEKVVMDMGRAVGLGLGRFLQQKDELGAVKRIRALRKKLQQIEALEARRGEGYALDSQQRAKLRSKEDIVAAVEALEQGREPSPPKEAKLSAEEWKVVGFSPERGEETEEEEKGKKGKSKAKRGGKAAKSVRGVRAAGEENPLLKKSASETSLGALEAASPLQRMESETTSVLESLDLPKSPVKVSEGFALPGVVTQDPPAPTVLSPTPFDTSRSTLDPSPGALKPSLNLPPTPNSWSPATPPNPAFLPNPKTPKPKKSAKRGGLSMFLSGALEAVAAAPTPPPLPTPPKQDGPAWGGVGVSPGPPRNTSLREIQNQQGFAPAAVSWSGPLGVNGPSASGRGEKVKLPGRAPSPNTPPSSSGPVAAPQGATWQGPPRPESCSPSTSGDYSKWGSSPQEKGASWSAFTTPPGRNRPVSDGANVPPWTSPIAAPPKGVFTPARPAQARSVPAGAGVVADVFDGEEGGPQRISLAHFVRPEKLSKKKAAQEEVGQKGWAARAPQSAAIPASSLRAIQEQQEKQRRQREGFAAGSPGTSPAPERASPGTSPSGTMRWYKPDPDERPSNIRAIQTEEAAMKQLRKIYGFDQVRLVTSKGER